MTENLYLEAIHNYRVCYVLFTKRNATNRPMVDADLHAGILSSKADDHPSLVFSGIRSCGVDTGEQFVEQFAPFKTVCSTTIWLIALTRSASVFKHDM